MGVDQRPSEPGRQPGLVEPETAEEMGEALGGRHLAMIERPQALGLPPALAESLVAGLETDVRRLRLQDGVEHARGGAHGPSVDLDLRHALAVEADQRVEEIEEDGGVRRQSGFLPA